VENFGFSSIISTTFGFSGSPWLGWERKPKKKRQKDNQKKFKFKFKTKKLKKKKKLEWARGKD
jgi:hypothetical protein